MQRRPRFRVEVSYLLSGDSLLKLLDVFHPFHGKIARSDVRLVEAKHKRKLK